MASLGKTFDPNAQAPSTGGGGKLHPKGDFELEIRASEVGPTRNGKGKVLKMEVFNTGRDDPALRDMKVFANINLENESVQAQTIGQGELTALCLAIGETGTVEDSELLHYRPFYARIDHEQAKDFKNDGKLMFKDNGDPLMNAIIRRYLFEDETGASEAAPAQQAQAQPPPAQKQTSPAGGGRTWQKRRPA